MRTAIRAATPEKRLDDLVEQFALGGIQPLDAYHMAAMLEVNGWTDGKATLLGFDDVFALAETLVERVRARQQTRPLAIEEEVGTPVCAYRAIRLYLRGLTFALPMLLSSFSVLTLRYSLWSYTGFSNEIATAIALGTLGSFLLAGGFTQAIARRGLYYIQQNQYGLTRRVSLRLMGIGILCMLLTTVAGLLFLTLVPLLPWSILKIALLYYVLLTLTWLGAGLLYMLQHELTILALVGAGILVVYATFELGHWPIMTAQFLGMTTVALGAILVATEVMFVLGRANKDENENLPMPRWSKLSWSLAPFFLFGAAYFALLFMDRVMAWSVPGIYHPYFIWFLGDYELGLDWALWTLVIPLALAEVNIHGFFSRIRIRQQVTAVHDIDAFDRRFLQEHRRTSLMLFASGLASIPLILAVIGMLDSWGLLPLNPLDYPITSLVFFIASPAYSLVAVGLQNTLLLFSMNVIWPPVRACGLAALGSMLVGFLATRYGDFVDAAGRLAGITVPHSDGHHWAVLGLVTGAVLFVWLSGRAAWDVLGRLDYHLHRMN